MVVGYGCGVDYHDEGSLRRGVGSDDIFVFVDGGRTWRCPPSHLPPTVKVRYKFRRFTREVII